MVMLTYGKTFASKGLRAAGFADYFPEARVKYTDRIPRSSMESPGILILILAAITFADQAHSQTISATKNPIAVGGNVTLVSNFSVTAGGWVFNNQHVVLTLSGFVKIANAWINRVTYDPNTSSLTIRSLTLGDSGVYALEEIDHFFSVLTLKVEEPVSNVTLQANPANLVEFNDTAVLVCSVSKGTPLSFAWMNGSSAITAGGTVKLSNGNTTLTIVNVTRYDTGPYSCQVSNDVSHEIGPPVNLMISYGPSNAKVMIMPLNNLYKGGSDITLSCSAESSPPPVIQWMFDGMYLSQTGSNLHLQNVHEGNSGNYTCLLHNTVTSRFTSATAAIHIMDPVTAAVVSHSPAILGETFSLMCDLTGTADIIHWWKNGHLISADNKTTFSADNKMLTISSALQSDGGHYQCQAFNSVSNMTSSSYTVTVNSGPEMANVTGPNLAKAGETVTFSCNAISTPPSLYTWYFNNFLVSTESVYVTPPLTSNMTGHYMCMASNSITGKNSNASIWLNVVDPIQNVKVETRMSATEGLSYNLTCSTNAPADYIYWMKNDQPLNENTRTVFHMENQTVNLNPVERYHDGNYQCLAINAVSKMLSDPYMLLVNYGPENPIIYGPTFAQTGHQAVFNCSAVSVPPSQFYWWFNGSIIANTSVYTTNHLSLNMSGEYTCMAVNDVTGRNSTSSVMFTVIDPVNNVNVNAPVMPAIEGSSYNLTCSLTGHADHIYWMKNWQRLHEDNRTIFYMDKTLHFNSVGRNDSGNYECMAINAVSNMTSPPYKLIVNYGPDTPVIYGPAFVEKGQQAVFSCSAVSVPPSQFYWWFNGSIVANTSMYTTNPLSFNMSGNYTCMAFNSVTGKSSTNFTTLTVIAAIESVKIRNTTIPINNANFDLTCEVVGPYDTIYWMKDDMPLGTNGFSSNSQMFYNAENKMLHFTPLTLYGDGTYQCVATNKAGRHVSAGYRLLVNYGPLSVSISRSNVFILVTLTCTANARPDCDYQWFFNNLSTPLQTGPVVVFRASPQSLGNYICKARNPVTNITMLQNYTVTGRASAIHFPYQGTLMMVVLFAFSTPMLFN